MTPLSDLELTVLALVADGHGNTGAAQRLGLTKGVVTERLRSVRDKLGAVTTAHAVHLAHRRGLLDRPVGAPACTRYVDPVPHRPRRGPQQPPPGRACAGCGVPYREHPARRVA